MQFTNDKNMRLFGAVPGAFQNSSARTARIMPCKGMVFKQFRVWAGGRWICSYSLRFYKSDKASGQSKPNFSSAMFDYSFNVKDESKFLTAFDLLLKSLCLLFIA